jgi:hypothetical protein
MCGMTDCTQVPMPTNADKQNVALLPPNVTQKLVDYCESKKWHGSHAGGCTISSARRYGKVLLIVFWTNVYDGDVSIVFDLGKDEVVGGFFWYVQG